MTVTAVWREAERETVLRLLEHVSKVDYSMLILEPQCMQDEHIPNESGKY